MAVQATNGYAFTPAAEALLLMVRRRAFELHRAHRKCQRSLTERSLYMLRQAARHLAPPLEVSAAGGLRDTNVHRALNVTTRILKLTSTLRDLHVRTRLLKGAKLEEVLRDELLLRIRNAQRSEERRVASGLKTIRKGVLLRLDTGFWPSLSAQQVHQGLRAALDHHRDRLTQRIRELRSADPRTLHRARVALKRTRYLLEAVKPNLPLGPEQGEVAMADLQKQLGNWHDGHLLAEWLREQSAQLAPELRGPCRMVADQHQRRSARAARALIARMRKRSLPGDKRTRSPIGSPIR